MRITNPNLWRADKVRNVNLKLAHRLLITAEQQRDRRLEVHDRDAAREIQLMIEAGLVTGSGPSESDPYSGAIFTITDDGLRFLRALGNLPDDARRSET